MHWTLDGVLGIREAEPAHTSFLARCPAYVHTTLPNQLRKTHFGSSMIRFPSGLD